MLYTLTWYYAKKKLRLKIRQMEQEALSARGEKVARQLASQDISSSEGTWADMGCTCHIQFFPNKLSQFHFGSKTLAGSYVDQLLTLPEEISFTKIPDATGKGFQDDKIDTAAASSGSEVVPTEPDSDVEVLDSAAATCLPEKTEAPAAAVEEKKPQHSEELQAAAAELEEEAKEPDDKNLRRLQLASRTEAKEAQQAAKEAKEEEKKKKKAEAKPKGRPRKTSEDAAAKPRKPRGRKGGKVAGEGEAAVVEAEAAAAGKSQEEASSSRKRPAAAPHSDRRSARRARQPVQWEYPPSVRPELVEKFVKLMDEWDNVKYDKAEMTLHTQSLVSTYDILCRN